MTLFFTFMDDFFFKIVLFFYGFQEEQICIASVTNSSSILRTPQQKSLHGHCESGLSVFHSVFTQLTH